MGINYDKLKIENYDLKEANKVLGEQAKQAQDKLDGEVSASANLLSELQTKISSQEKVLDAYGAETKAQEVKIEALETQWVEASAELIGRYSGKDLILMGIKKIFKRKK